MRPADIVTQVQEGRCHLGVTGWTSTPSTPPKADQAVVVVPDLGYGGCRLVVAVPESWIDVSHVIDLVDLTTEFKAPARRSGSPPSTPRWLRQYFRTLGHLLLPADRFRRRPRAPPEPGDRRHHRRPHELGHDAQGQSPPRDRGGTVLDSAACLIGHARSCAALAEEGESGPLALLLDAIDGVRRSEGLLHMEVVGRPPGRAARPRPPWRLSRDQGPSTSPAARSGTSMAGGWRVTGLVAASKLTACQRVLFSLGASRVVGLPAQFVFDKDRPLDV